MTSIFTGILALVLSLVDLLLLAIGGLLLAVQVVVYSTGLEIWRFAQRNISAVRFGRRGEGDREHNGRQKVVYIEDFVGKRTGRYRKRRSGSDRQ